MTRFVTVLPTPNTLSLASLPSLNRMTHPTRSCHPTAHPPQSAHVQSSTAPSGSSGVTYLRRLCRLEITITSLADTASFPRCCTSIKSAPQQQTSHAAMLSRSLLFVALASLLLLSPALAARALTSNGEPGEILGFAPKLDPLPTSCWL